jgi:hypothetical protein
MGKGFLKVILYYLTGIVLAGLSYVVFGQGYAHGPGLHHAIILLTFAGGTMWGFLAILYYLTEKRTESLKGIILGNVLMTVGFSVFMTVLFGNERNPVEPDDRPDKIVVEESADTTTMYHNVNVFYYKVGDSVLINFIDSTRIDWKKIEVVKKVR